MPDLFVSYRGRNYLNNIKEYNSIVLKYDRPIITPANILEVCQLITASTPYTDIALLYWRRMEEAE